MMSCCHTKRSDKPHLLLISQALQQEVVHIQRARGQALQEPGVRLDLLHGHTLAGLGDQHPRQDVQAVCADLHILHQSTGQLQGPQPVMQSCSPPSSCAC